MLDFVCPASANHCPSSQEEIEVELEEEDHLVYRGYLWAQTVPSPDAPDWHCKYRVRAARGLVASENEDERGYIYVQVEPYGFDEDVFLIIQPYKRFCDYSNDNPGTITQVLPATFGRNFYIPAEYEVLISFAPLGNSPQS